jgi:anthranilate phosphoribosyltransferase
MIGPVLRRLLVDRPLSRAEAARAFATLLEPTATEGERAAILVALSARPPRAVELGGFARELRRQARPFPFAANDAPIDLCGTGGAPRPSFNVSTASAFVVAAAGVPVVKHGNRSARGICGSSDLLEALGLPVTRSLGFAAATYRRHRLAFLHAPLYHPATAAVAPVRKLLGVPTVFNRLGPLSNPAAVPYQVVGTPDPATARLFAEVLPALGVRRGLTLSSHEGCDEFSPRRPTVVYRWGQGAAGHEVVRPERFLTAAERTGAWGPLAPSAAAEAVERLLGGAAGARRGAVVLTSGAALRVVREVPSLEAGVERARTVIDDGRAAALLGSLREMARGFPEGAP